MVMIQLVLLAEKGVHKKYVIVKKKKYTMKAKNWTSKLKKIRTHWTRRGRRRKM
jgi:hypothetical protein